MNNIIVRNTLISITIFLLTACGGDSSTTFQPNTSNESNTSNEPIQHLSLENINIPVIPVGEVRTYQIPQGQNVSYSIINKPSWLSINSNGLITANADTNDTGNYTFKIVATNATETITSDDINVEVKNINEDVTTDVLGAPLVNVESLVKPVKNVGLDGTLMVPNKDGLSWDILQVYAKTYGGPNEIVIIDTGSGEIKHIIQNDYMNWHLAESVIAPNGKLFIITGVRPGLTAAINVYNPETNTFEMNAVSLPNLTGETATLTLGTDGEVYLASGTDSKARIVKIDDDTYAVTDYGKVRPNDANALMRPERVCSDATNVYVVSGVNPFYLDGIEKAEPNLTKTYATSSDRIGMVQTEFGCYSYIDGKMYFLYEGSLIEAANGIESTPPWPIPDERKNENTLYKIRTVVDLPEKPIVQNRNARADIDGKAQTWVNENSSWKAYNYDVVTHEHYVMRIYTLANGNIFGTGGSYSGNFIYDTHTEKSQFLGTLALSHATSVELNGKVYMSGYPSSSTFVYDLSKKWTQNQKNWEPGVEIIDPKSETLNPKFLGYFRDYSGTHASKSMAVDNDGYVYVAGEWRRDGHGGGLSWYNPQTGQSDGISDIFSNYQIHNITTVNNGALIVISTKAIEDLTLGKPTPTQGRIFVFDAKSKKIINSFDPLAESRTTGDIIGTDGPYILGVSTNDGHDKTYIYRLNVENGKVDYKSTYNLFSQFRTQGEYKGGSLIAKGPKGKIWTFMGGRLINIEPVSGEVTGVGRLVKDGSEGQYGGLAFSGDDLYLSVTNDLRRVSNIAQ